MNSTDLDMMKLKYQELSDYEKFAKYAHDYAEKRVANSYKSADSYWCESTNTDKNCPNIFRYHFPTFLDYREELQKIFEAFDLPEPNLYSFICAIVAYKHQPHVMLLWERRKAHGLTDYTLNTHELLLGKEDTASVIEKMLGEGVEQIPEMIEETMNQNQSSETDGIPDNLRYTLF